MREWQRLKAHIDGLGPSSYTATGALIPEGQAIYVPPVYCPPLAAHSVTAFRRESATAVLQPPAKPDNPFILGVGFHPELAVTEATDNPNLSERRISTLATAWLDHRRKLTECGELSLKQWAEDKAKLTVFQQFVLTNYPTAVFVEQIDAAMLNLYRDKQREFVECEGEHKIGKATLKKRLACLTRWLQWLVDENVLPELPKDLSKFCQVTLDKPQPIFWTIEQIKLLTKHATERTQLYIMLALNLGYTQKDIDTLFPSMIDWETGIVTRPRHKTGVASKAKLWPSTLKLLQEHRNPNDKGPVLVNQKGTRLLDEWINKNGKLISNDSIRLAFDRLKKHKQVNLENDPRSRLAEGPGEVWVLRGRRTTRR